MKRRISLLLLAILFSFSLILVGQSDPIVIEAESGTLGSDITTGTDGDITYIAPSTNFIEPATLPNDDIKVVTFSITFPKSGIYQLFARLRVGSSTFDDDSFFLGKGFGTKSSATEGDWIIVNQLAAAGYTALTDVVFESGGSGSEVWKWVNLSVFTGGTTFTVADGDLTQTLQIAAREDGLWIDKLIFAEENLFFTVANLNNEEPGTTYNPDDSPVGPPIADGLDKFLGCGFGPDSKSKFEGFWNQVTPGNGGKWGWVEGTRDVMNWTDLDEAYNLAKEFGFVYKHHVLVWGGQQPTWIETLDTAEQLDEIEEWFAAIAERYDTIDLVEVVNEPLHQPPDANNGGKYIDALGGSGETGWDWIIKSFKLARNNFPNSKLLINEYGIINSMANTKKYLEIIRLLQAEDLIDAISFQAHGFSLDASVQVSKEILDSLAATGLDIYVSELDIDGPTDISQLQDYMKYFSLFWEYPSIKGITLWGYKPGMWRTEQKAYLINTLGEERLAMKWLRAYIGGTFERVESVSISTAGDETSIETIGETLQLTATVNPSTATIPDIVWKVNDKKIATIDSLGLLTAVAEGIVTVTAKSVEYGTEAIATIDITISQSTGIYHDILSNNISIYPNPSNNGVFTINGLDEISTINVIDLVGNLIQTYSITNQSSITIHLDMPPGMYILQLSNGHKNEYKRIIMK